MPTPFICCDWCVHPAQRSAVCPFCWSPPRIERRPQHSGGRRHTLLRAFTHWQEKRIGQTIVHAYSHRARRRQLSKPWEQLPPRFPPFVNNSPSHNFNFLSCVFFDVLTTHQLDLRSSNQGLVCYRCDLTAEIVFFQRGSIYRTHYNSLRVSAKSA